MLRALIVWCLLLPLLCVFAAGVVAAVIAAFVLVVSGFTALRVVQWGEQSWNRK